MTNNVEYMGTFYLKSLHLGYSYRIPFFIQVTSKKRGGKFKGKYVDFYGIANVEGKKNRNKISFKRKYIACHHAANATDLPSIFAESKLYPNDPGAGIGGMFQKVDQYASGDYSIEQTRKKSWTIDRIFRSMWEYWGGRYDDSNVDTPMQFEMPKKREFP